MNAQTDIINATKETVSEMVEAPKAKATKPKATTQSTDKAKAALAKAAEAKKAKAAQEKAEKAAAKAKADEAKAAAKAAKEAEAAKPVPTYAGFEVVEGADLETLATLTKEASEAFEAVGRKDSDLHSHYLALGKFQSVASGMFKSTKIYGQFLAKELPASQSLDAALRSNCKWLYEALNVADHEGSDLLSVLKINRIEDFKSGNPTVIKREYKLAKAKAALAAKAKAAGVEGEEEEALADAGKELTRQEKEEANKKAEKAFNAALGKAIAKIRKEVAEHLNAGMALANDDDKGADPIVVALKEGFDNAVEDLLTYLKDVTKLSPQEGLSYLQSGGDVENDH